MGKKISWEQRNEGGPWKCRYIQYMSWGMILGFSNEHSSQQLLTMLTFFSAWGIGYWHTHPICVHCELWSLWKTALACLESPKRGERISGWTAFWSRIGASPQNFLFLNFSNHLILWIFLVDVKRCFYFFLILFRNLTTEFKVEDFVWWHEFQNICYWNI